MRKLYLVFVFMAISSCLFPQIKTVPYQELPTAGGQPSGSGVFLGAMMSASSITITFVGPSDRWIALGFGQGMFPTDVFIYSVGRMGAFHPIGWNDYYNSSQSTFGVNNDSQQNWTVVSTATIAPLQRTVTATRALSTGDANDVAFNFNATVLDVVWAFGASPDYTIAYHGNNNRANLIALPWLSPPTASFVSSTTVCLGAPIVYTNASTGGQTTYTWNFQGGTPGTSTLTNPSVTYSLPGTYSVALTASNAVGSNTYTQVNYITVTQTVSPSVSIALTSGSNPMCAGASVSFSATTANGGSSPSFQWKIGGTNSGPNNPVFTTSALTASTNITCVLTSNATCANPTTFTSAPISMTVNSTAPATLSTSLISGSNPMCIGAMAVFTAVPGNGGTSPQFQWAVNNVTVGVTAASFSTTTLNNSDLVSCMLTSNAPCASNTLGLSTSIQMTVSSALVPSVNINASSSTLCAGTTVTLTANFANGGLSPIYNWQVNGINAGSNSTMFTTALLANGATVTCLMTSALACANPSTGLSNSIIFTVNPIPPTPTIIGSGDFGLCSGESVTLSSSAGTGNVWTNGSTSQDVVVNSGTHVVQQVINGCSSPMSAQVTITVFPLPTATLFAVNPVCKDAPPIQLLGAPPGGIYSGQGVSGSTFTPASASTGSNNILVYQYTSVNNCKATASIQVVVDECLAIGAIAAEVREVLVYPNPGPGRFTVYSRQQNIVSLRVMDAKGKTVKPTEFLHAKTVVVNLEDQPAGIYLLEIRLQNQTITSRISKTD